MHEAIARMLARYDCRSLNNYTNALREILQEVALLGLWRGKFFEKAAFYGGTALRILYGLDQVLASDGKIGYLVSASTWRNYGRYMPALEIALESFNLYVPVPTEPPWWNIEKFSWLIWNFIPEWVINPCLKGFKCIYLIQWQ